MPSSKLSFLSPVSEEDFFQNYFEKQILHIKRKDDGFFNSEYVSQVNNPLDLKEQGINRFQFLHLDPQKNAIEPFPRLGNNTVLETLDNHKTFC